MHLVLAKVLIIATMLGIVVAAFCTIMLMLTGQYSFWLLLALLILEFAAQILLRRIYDRLPALLS